MEVVDSCAALLSNYEVLMLLKEQQARREARNAGSNQRSSASTGENVLTVEFEVCLDETDEH